MNLSKRMRAVTETAIETVLGLAAGAPVALATTGTSQQVGTGAVVLAVSVAVTNLAHVPAVERFLDRVLGKGGEAQLVTLASELQGVESVVAEHIAQHPTAAAAAPAAVAPAAQPDSGTPPTSA